MAHVSPYDHVIVQQIVRAEMHEAFCLDPVNHPTCTGPVASVNPNKNGTCEKCGRVIP